MMTEVGKRIKGWEISPNISLTSDRINCRAMSRVECLGWTSFDEIEGDRCAWTGFRFEGLIDWWGEVVDELAWDWSKSVWFGERRWVSGLVFISRVPTVQYNIISTTWLSLVYLPYLQILIHGYLSKLHQNKPDQSPCINQGWLMYSPDSLHGCSTYLIRIIQSPVTRSDFQRWSHSRSRIGNGDSWFPGTFKISRMKWQYCTYIQYLLHHFTHLYDLLHHQPQITFNFIHKNILLRSEFLMVRRSWFWNLASDDPSTCFQTYWSRSMVITDIHWPLPLSLHQPDPWKPIWSLCSPSSKSLSRLFLFWSLFAFTNRWWITRIVEGYQYTWPTLRARLPHEPSSVLLLRTSYRKIEDWIKYPTQLS